MTLFCHFDMLLLPMLFRVVCCCRLRLLRLLLSRHATAARAACQIRYAATLSIYALRRRYTCLQERAGAFTPCLMPRLRFFFFASYAMPDTMPCHATLFSPAADICHAAAIDAAMPFSAAIS